MDSPTSPRLRPLDPSPQPHIHNHPHTPPEAQTYSRHCPFHSRGCMDGNSPANSIMSRSRSPHRGDSPTAMAAAGAPERANGTRTLDPSPHPHIHKHPHTPPKPTSNPDVTTHSPHIMGRNSSTHPHGRDSAHSQGRRWSAGAREGRERPGGEHGCGCVLF